MKIWITGTSKAARSNYVADWLCEHLEAAGHTPFVTSWDPVEIARARWVEVLRSSNADVLVQADELRGGYACRNEPARAAAVNVGGTAVMAQAAREAGVPFAYLGSAEATVGTDLYGILKLAAEQAARLHSPQCQLIRLSNLYGPGAAAGLDAPMPNRFLEWAYNDEPVSAHTDLWRSWCHVGDAVRAIRMVLEDGRPGIWNVGCDDNAALSMFELARHAARIARRADENEIEVTEAGWKPGAPRTRSLDTTALLSLGWEPQVNLEEGMRDTAAWLRLPAQV